MVPSFSDQNNNSAKSAKSKGKLDSATLDVRSTQFFSSFLLNSFINESNQSEKRKRTIVEIDSTFGRLQRETYFLQIQPRDLIIIGPPTRGERKKGGKRFSSSETFFPHISRFGASPLSLSIAYT